MGEAQYFRICGPLRLFYTLYIAIHKWELKRLFQWDSDQVPRNDIMNGSHLNGRIVSILLPLLLR